MSLLNRLRMVFTLLTKFLRSIFQRKNAKILDTIIARLSLLDGRLSKQDESLLLSLTALSFDEQCEIGMRFPRLLDCFICMFKGPNSSREVVDKAARFILLHRFKYIGDDSDLKWMMEQNVHVDLFNYFQDDILARFYILSTVLVSRGYEQKQNDITNALLAASCERTSSFERATTCLA